jgi:hypothetical protein
VKVRELIKQLLDEDMNKEVCIRVKEDGAAIANSMTREEKEQAEWDARHFGGKMCASNWCRCKS